MRGRIALQSTSCESTEEASSIRPTVAGLLEVRTPLRGALGGRTFWTPGVLAQGEHSGNREDCSRVPAKSAFN